MIKTHKKSEIFTHRADRLKEIEGIIIQCEHYPGTMHGNEYCLVEVVAKENYDTESELERTKNALNELRKTHGKLCSDILSALKKVDNTGAVELKNMEYIIKAIDIAEEWFC